LKLHRFFANDENLKDKLEITDKNLVWQWNKVLRFQTGQNLVLFNQAMEEAAYSVTNISKSSAFLQKLYDVKPKIPERQLYLFWSLLKRDNNELVLQKCTELGITHFIPLITERTIKKDFNFERAEKIVVEASEQCGRTDIPSISQPVKLENAIADYARKIELLIADQAGELAASNYKLPSGVMIGPEGGWTKTEQELFIKNKLKKLNVSQLTLRAETAAIVAVAKLL
jgi:16S rRNA (uracil1498-N3)-methyltransferase